MWRISLRDLQWRLRRFVIAVLAAGLVFALTLLLSGVLTGIHREAGRIIRTVGAQAWLVPEGASGPFTATSFVQADRAEDVAALPGVEEAEPLAILRGTAGEPDSLVDVNLIGHPVGSLGTPRVTNGRVEQARGEAVVDTMLGYDVGDTILVGGFPLQVVGEADKVTYFFGTPTVFTTLEDAQQIGFFGQPLASTIATRGVPDSVPDGMELRLNDAVERDLRRPAKSGEQTVAFINVLLWIVAAGIIGAVIYLSALERTRDFAVLKATGATSRSLLGGLLLQAVMVCVASALVGVAIARLLAPIFPLAVEAETKHYLQLAAVSLGVALLASVIGLRRAVKADPALAFGGP